MPDLTPNLGLKKPLGNENVTRTAYNENLDLIDFNAAKASDVTSHLAETAQGDDAHGAKTYADTKISKAGDTMTGLLTIDGSGLLPLIAQKSATDAPGTYPLGLSVMPVIGGTDWPAAVDASGHMLVVTFSGVQGSGNRMFQIVSGKTSNVLQMRTPTTDGSVWGPWITIYTGANKPTAADIGAVNKSGDVMTDSLSVEKNSYPGFQIRETANNRRGVFEHNGTEVSLHNTVLDASSDVMNSNRTVMRLRNETAAVSDMLILQRHSNSLTATTYKLFGEHNVTISTSAPSSYLGSGNQHQVY